jgi:hypothetical protein
MKTPSRCRQPKAIYGTNSYAYRQLRRNDTEAAAVYRFMKDDIGFECIVSTLAAILKSRCPPPRFPTADDARANNTAFPDWNAISYQDS